MHYQMPLFSRFGGGPNRPNIARQLVIIFGAWLAAKTCINNPRGGGDSTIEYKYTKPKLLSH